MNCSALSGSDHYISSGQISCRVILEDLVDFNGVIGVHISVVLGYETLAIDNRANHNCVGIRYRDSSRVYRVSYDNIINEQQGGVLLLPANQLAWVFNPQMVMRRAVPLFPHESARSVGFRFRLSLKLTNDRHS